MSDNSHYHKRHSIRLRHYDYTSPGYYFVTICTHQRVCLFDDTRYRRIAENTWRSIAKDRVGLDAWVTMPDHVHGIIVIHRLVERDNQKAGQLPHDCPPEYEPPWQNVMISTVPTHTSNNLAVPQRSGLGIQVVSGSLGALVRSYKSMVTRRINKLRRTPGGTVWQRGYWERIVRNEGELNAIRRYIIENPLRESANYDQLDTLLARMTWTSA